MATFWTINLVMQFSPWVVRALTGHLMQPSTQFRASKNYIPNRWPPNLAWRSPARSFLPSNVFLFQTFLTCNFSHKPDRLGTAENESLPSSPWQPFRKIRSPAKTCQELFLAVGAPTMTSHQHLQNTWLDFWDRGTDFMRFKTNKPAFQLVVLSHTSKASLIQP